MDTPTAPLEASCPAPKALSLGEIAAQQLMPLAIQAYQDLLVSAKSEKVRLEAANAVAELAGARQRSPSSLGLTFNMPPEYLAKTFKAMSKLTLSPADKEGAIDVAFDDPEVPLA